MRTTVLAVLCGLLIASPAYPVAVDLLVVPDAADVVGGVPVGNSVKVQVQAVIADVNDVPNKPGKQANGIVVMGMDLLVDPAPAGPLAAVALNAPWDGGPFANAGTPGAAAITGIKADGNLGTAVRVGQGEPLALLEAEIAIDGDAVRAGTKQYTISVGNIVDPFVQFDLVPGLAQSVGVDPSVVTPGSLTLVPEPASLACVLLGSGLVWLRRRR